MYVMNASQQPEPSHVPGGYEPRPQDIAAMLGMQQIIPPEVVMAMRFIDMCNAVTKPVQYCFTEDSEPVEAGMHLPDMHPYQEAAFRRACVRLGRFFDGDGPRRKR